MDESIEDVKSKTNSYRDKIGENGNKTGNSKDDAIAID
jgi:hypothetical protein